jgi:hypothetical protein
VIDEVLHHRGPTLVRRPRLAPGEATPWHRIFLLDAAGADPQPRADP